MKLVRALCSAPSSSVVVGWQLAAAGESSEMMVITVASGNAPTSRHTTTRRNANHRIGGRISHFGSHLPPTAPPHLMGESQGRKWKVVGFPTCLALGPRRLLASCLPLWPRVDDVSLGSGGMHERARPKGALSLLLQPLGSADAKEV